MKIKYNSNGGAEMELSEYALVEIHNRLGGIEALLRALVANMPKSNPYDMHLNNYLDNRPKIEINGESINPVKYTLK